VPDLLSFSTPWFHVRVLCVLTSPSLHIYEVFAAPKPIGAPAENTGASIDEAL